MPTKLNRAGNQQNYVPKGNGDASGEYGDNANGSNKHFKVFEKPKSQDGEEKIKEIKSKIDELVNNNGTSTQLMKLLSENNIKGDLFSELGNYFNDKRAEKVAKEKENEPKIVKKTKKDLINAISGNIGKMTPNAETLIENIKNAKGDERTINLFANMYEKGHYTFKLGRNLNSCFEYSYSGIYKGIILGKESLDGTYQYNQAEVFYHESGHALDYTSKGENHFWSMDYKSKKYNMSLQESVNDELSIFLDNKKFDELSQEIADFKQQYKTKIEEERTKVLQYQQELAKYGDEVKEYTNNSVQQALGYTQKDLTRELTMGRLSLKKYLKELEKVENEEEQAKEDYGKINKEYGEHYSKYKNALQKMTKYQQERSGNSFKKYGDLSDMIQAITGSQLEGGHDDGYFSGKKGKKNQATECFAEITSAKSTNPESYEMLKKYIPRTLEIYEELIGVIESGNQ